MHAITNEVTSLIDLAMGYASVKPMTFSVGQSARVSYHCMEHAPSRSINILKEFKALYFFARVSFGTSIKIAVHPRKGVPKVRGGAHFTGRLGTRGPYIHGVPKIL